MISGGAGMKDCDVWRPAGIHRELVRFQAVQIWKNRLFCSEDQEQVSRVSVHCKLGTRATQDSVYRQRRGGVKSSLNTRGDPILSGEVYAVVSSNSLNSSISELMESDEPSTKMLSPALRMDELGGGICGC